MVLVQSKYSPCLYLEKLRRTMRNLNHHSQCPSQDSNQVPAEYKSRVLPLVNLLGGVTKF
jgi:hypothetical protein